MNAVEKENAFQRESKSSFSEAHRNLGNVTDPYKESKKCIYKIKLMMDYVGLRIFIFVYRSIALHTTKPLAQKLLRENYFCKDHARCIKQY